MDKRYWVSCKCLQCDEGARTLINPEGLKVDKIVCGTDKTHKLFEIGLTNEAIK